MKKYYLIIVVIIMLVGAAYYSTKKKVPVDTSITTYRNANLGITFVYPKILSASTTSSSVRIHHEVPFEHRDYCDFKGDGDESIPNLTDFNVSFHISNGGLVNTMKAESPYIPAENFVNNEVVPSPGFIDTYAVGELKGFKIFEGAEGCGQTTYYFSISKNKTLVATQELVTVFTGAIDSQNKERAEAVPGVINRERADDLFESILKTLVVQ